MRYTAKPKGYFMINKNHVLYDSQITKPVFFTKYKIHLLFLQKKHKHFISTFIHHFHCQIRIINKENIFLSIIVSKNI